MEEYQLPPDNDIGATSITRLDNYGYVDTDPDANENAGTQQNSGLSGNDGRDTREKGPWKTLPVYYPVRRPEKNLRGLTEMKNAKTEIKQNR